LPIPVENAIKDQNQVLHSGLDCILVYTATHQVFRLPEIKEQIHILT